jgi:hypothetical protein
MGPRNWPKGTVVDTVNLPEPGDRGDAVDQPLSELQRRDFELHRSDLLDHTIPPCVNRLAWVHLIRRHLRMVACLWGIFGESRVQSQNYPPETARSE